ncbi:TadE/TadG family type IV pilus assembly protein [Blastopirellula sediminis]|uniref:TadE/TadG family type IV pilus assembly protein n=1 Tax=Blastopirellula sediminis TaxID=2894196 RepID=UPI0028F3E3B0|nr:TadE/TadG family type IV pilus assembly protein [Blastopirellula sediminis]
MTTHKFRLHRPCRLYRSYRTGAAVVEFAIVAPLFFLLVFGMIEYGRMVMVQQVITNASREGARRAVLDGATTTEVVAAVEEFLNQASVSGPNLEIRVSPDPPSSAENGDPVGVTVIVPFSDVSWIPSPMYLGGTTLEAKTVMRREGIK